MSDRVAERIISVGGGKGGVGKSVVASNLAVAMAMDGKDVVLVDADLGAANQHTLLGLEKPGPTLQSFLDHQVDSLEAARVATGIPGLSLVRGAGAVVGAANLAHAKKQRLIRNLAKLEAQIIVIDVGAGSAFNQLDLFDAADLKVVVVTPQLTSIQNAYAFLKGAVFRSIADAYQAHGQLELLGTDAKSEVARLPVLLKRTKEVAPLLAAQVQAQLDAFGLRLFGNQVLDANEAQTFRAVAKLVHDFLGLSAPCMGFARSSRGVHESVNKRRPFLLDARQEETAQAFRRAARLLMDEPLPRRSQAVAQSANAARVVA